MRVKPMILLSAGVVLAMLVVALVAGAALPDNAALPVHWNVDGQADRYDTKWTALCIAPAVTAAISALLAVLPAINPLREGLERSATLYRTAWIGLLGLMAVTQALPVGAAFGWHLQGHRLVIAAMGVFLIVLGNVLPKSRPTWFVGIRTPWTMASADVWIATHRLGGRLMIVAGLVWIACALIDRAPASTRLLTAGSIAVAAIVPILWSYLLWREQSHRDA